MLKLIYLDNDFYLEYLTQSLEEWVALRVTLALRIDKRICVEPSMASFLLPADLPGLDSLAAEVQRLGEDVITLCACDADYVEVSLHGTWFAFDTETEEGIFVTNLDYVMEFLLFKLWQEAQMGATVVGE
ncbi:alr0857 family protein [Gloeocapsopsis dulcis]|uniref:Uncharacterized protein n=1 Tax=Gloeocapsopsis dulcis AAB1 = 1H9 TaxID=1433147 RepID=A0A6N8FST0_9CHRO|nr:alr0857 family protein [Gloeocapsopsis dulcis]MUL36168.1 hypothetical protein [Gloeocapsopsis dulcis AAB1 = 1H9]WNN91357.1 hypothetical protein P0S91_09910 [Gloeocapsopsis dulcis]